jgi:hypothetical protein
VAAVATAKREEALTDSAPDGRSGGRLFEPGGVTLEDAIRSVWDELTQTGRAPCPVCDGSLGTADGCDGCGADIL